MKNSIQTGNCLNELQQMPENSVHMCMTSPPYWQLRDYGHEEQLGLEDTSDEYIQNLADIIDEVKRVLRADGSLWLNLGDTYDNKDLQQMPARVALELQERGWTLRNRVTWAKPNPMPNSVKDRLNTTTEAVFHLTPEPDYWYDLDAIREPHVRDSLNSHPSRFETAGVQGHASPNEDGTREGVTLDAEDALHPAGKNPGDVFEIATKPFPDAHFAVYPPGLCEKPIKATCPPTVCACCGTPYGRKKEVLKSWKENGVPEEESTQAHAINNPGTYARDSKGGFSENEYEFKGWRQPCDCNTDATEPGICLDPFAGAGTTLLKAKDLGRQFIGIELNPEYADMARARVGLAPNDPETVRDDKQQQGLESYQ